MISIEHRSEGRIGVRAPYKRAFIEGTRRLGGRWDKPHWTFDARNGAHVITLLEKVYGWKRPGPNEPKVTVRVEVVEEDWIGDRESLELAGVELAKALGRDSGAWVGHGVIITEGAIESCGSVKNWRVKAEAGTTFMIRDIPLSTARCMSDAARTLDLEVDYEQQQ